MKLNRTEFHFVYTIPMQHLSLEEEAMSLTAAIFIVRYRPVVFKTTFKIAESSIVSDVNSLVLGNLDDFHIDLKILHYAFEHYSLYFGNSAIGMTFTTTKKKGCSVAALSKEFSDIKQRGWEVTFNDYSYRNAEQVWIEKEHSSAINERVLSELVSVVRQGILRASNNTWKRYGSCGGEVVKTPRYPYLSCVMRVLHLCDENSKLSSHLVEALKTTANEAEVSLEKTLVGKVRRKEFLKLVVDSRQKNKILLDAETKINNVIYNICSESKYSELDVKEFQYSLDLRAEERNQCRRKQSFLENNDVLAKKHAKDKADAAIRRRRIQVDSESDSEDDDGMYQQSYAERFTDSNIKQQYLLVKQKNLTYSKEDKAFLVHFYELELDWAQNEE